MFDRNLSNFLRLNFKRHNFFGEISIWYPFCVENRCLNHRTLVMKVKKVNELIFSIR